tara:strand:- start:6688 stop:7101 length:414 start_codon:yes stop_codon:yes gene_type:complete
MNKNNKKDQLDKFIEELNPKIKIIQKMEQNTTEIEGLIDFEIVDKTIKEIKPPIKKVDILAQSIYNGANKLIVSNDKSLFIPIQVLSELKHPYSKIKTALDKLTLANKNAGNIVEYISKVSKDANSTVLGYYIWRLQ